MEIDSAFETRADKRRYLRRLLGMQLSSLVTCAFGIALATFFIGVGIESTRGETGAVIAAGVVVCGLPALFGWFIAVNSQSTMIDRWRDFMRPLPAIDGSVLTLERNRDSHPNIRSALFIVFWLGLGGVLLAKTWPSPTAIVLITCLFVYPCISVARLTWFPKATHWQPLILDAGGFEDRGLTIGKVAWDEVADIRWDSGIEVTLTQPRALPVASGFRSRIAGLFGRPLGQTTFRVGSAGSLDGHRVFRLMQAYWRYSRRDVGTLVARSAR